MLVKVMHIYDFVRGRQFPHITFYGEVQEQPMQQQPDCAKFIFSVFIATYDRSNHRRQWSDEEAMCFLQTNVKNYVRNCVITEGYGIQNIVRLHDHKDQSLASLMVDKKLAVATEYLFPEKFEDEKSSHCWGNTTQTHLNILPAGFNIGASYAANPRSMFPCSCNF